MAANGGRSLTARMVAAAKLEVAPYEEVEADTTATGQAALVVLGAGIIAIRQALDLGTGKAVFTALLGWMFPGFLALSRFVL